MGEGCALAALAGDAAVGCPPAAPVADWPPDVGEVPDDDAAADDDPPEPDPEPDELAPLPDEEPPDVLIGLDPDVELEGEPGLPSPPGLPGEPPPELCEIGTG
ncbi:MULTISPECIES: hypothetical protein [Mycolicibacterium]|uniref:hypothetical protein n=1 Tax=Mycolicibacterium TaxID=1866885 RepID=UPI0013014D1E|nr:MULTISPECIES: hypothetical protein [Mycolicibacterium]MCV7130708.1 hypothetical protein [Mycolicibacterium vanbaalenii PYR-1]